MNARYLQHGLRALPKPHPRTYSSSSPSTPLTSPFGPRHLLSIADLTAQELKILIRNAYNVKEAVKSGASTRYVSGSIAGNTVAMLFDKRSTRTRVSTEAAVARMGGSSMFLGKDDIQLGVNETARDTSTVISSMVQAIVARQKHHALVAELAKYSQVPVINALSDDFHPLQAITDMLTLHETFKKDSGEVDLEGLQIAWVGDANNVLFDIAIAAAKLGINLNVATPKGYEMPPRMIAIANEANAEAKVGWKLNQTEVPEEAVRDADVIFTDTWISMGQEQEKKERLEAFKGYQVTEELAERGSAKENWKFMHCLPRHAEEVSDEIFYHPERSLVFPEAENRMWTMIAVLSALMVHKGKIDLLNVENNRPRPPKYFMRSLKMP